MSLPTNVKTWQFKPNQAINDSGTILTNSRTTLLALKNGLISTSGWVDNTNVSTTPSNMFTTYYSCNSSIAGSAGDGIDRWSTITDLVWNSAASAHSWYVFEHTAIDTHCQLLISCEGSSSGGTVLTVVFSPSAGFTGGTTTARPTATDEIVLLSGSAWAVTTNTNVKLHHMKSSDGQCWRIFITNGAACTFVLMIEKATSLIGSSWTHQGVSWCKATSTTGTEQITSANVYAQALFNGRGTTAITFYLATMSRNAAPFHTVFTTASDTTSNWQFYPQCLSSETASNKGVFGYLNDVWYGSNTITTGSSFPASGTQYQFIQLGTLIFPWCQTNILMS